MEELVVIKNKDTKVEFSYPYGNDWEMVVIPPRKEKIVPWSVMTAFMGDPTLRNTDYWRERDEVYEKLIVFYGGEAPKIEAYTLDGARITTILDDPAGDAMAPQPGNTSDVGLLQKQIEAMQQKLDALARAELTGIADAVVDVEGEDDLAEDGPKKVPTSR